MPTSVPALDRAADILRFLGASPRSRFTLSEVARGTSISKATCSSVLSALEGHQMVHRDALLRFGLGDALLQLAEARRLHFPAFDAARGEAARLAGTTGLSVAIIARDGEDLVILDMLGDTQPAHLHMRMGMRVPLQPPIGTIFKAWAPTKEIDEWVDRLMAEFGGERSVHLSAIATMRSRKYSLGGEHDLNLELEAALRRLDRHDSDVRALEVALVVADKIRNFQSSDGRRSDDLVNSLIGPIFDNDGSVSMTLNVYGPLGTIRRSDLPNLVPVVLQASAAVTARTGGRLPAYWHTPTK